LFYVDLGFRGGQPTGEALTPRFGPDRRPAEEGLWPRTVPAVVLAECLQGHAGRDANENRFLKICDIADAVPESLARRAALLRRLARRGSAVDALVVAFAESGGTVLTSDPDDLEALAAHAADVLIERV